jgi:hypothetical protein
VDDVPRSLVGTAWIVARTGLDRTTIQKAAVRGRIPGAVKLLGVWRFDADLIDQWISAGMTPQTTTSTGMAEPLRSTSGAEHREGGGVSRIPDASNIPPLAVMFPGAAHRGLYPELPAERPARASAPRRRGGHKKAAIRR